MMSSDLYENFAERYDLIPESFAENDPREFEFFSTLFSGNRVRSVLDCACGTGRHLLLFHNLGCEVWGSDASQAMLGQARNNLAHPGIQIPLQLADYRDLPQHFQRSFDAVVCLASIGYMPDEAQFLRALYSMNAVLREGGILVLTTIPTDQQWKEKPRFKLAVNIPDVTRLFVMDYFERTVGYHVLDIFHNQEANELKVWSVEPTALLRDEQERLLRATGFQHVDFYGAFDFSPYDEEDSDRLITVAHR
jgi:ubiquinone/menaquinone biosynthesis C-methylase UbiE